MAQPTQHLYEFGCFRLDTSRRNLLRDGEVVQLTPKCYEILLALVDGGGDVVTKDCLIERVWPDSFVEEGNLTYNISMLRKALGERAGDHQFIITVPGQGYCLGAPVKELLGQSQESPSDNLATPIPAHRGMKSKLTIAAGLLIVFSGILVYWMVAKPKPLKESRPTTAVASIAVLPLANGSGDPEMEYLSDGISEALINNLSQLFSIKVIARTSSFKY